MFLSARQVLHSSRALLDEGAAARVRFASPVHIYENGVRTHPTTMTTPDTDNDNPEASSETSTEPSGKPIDR